MKRKRQEPGLASERTTTGRRLILGVSQQDLDRIRRQQRAAKRKR